MKLNPTVILKTIYSANMTFFANTKKKYTVNRGKGGKIFNQFSTYTRSSILKHFFLVFFLLIKAAGF